MSNIHDKKIRLIISFFYDIILAQEHFMAHIHFHSNGLSGFYNLWTAGITRQQKLLNAFSDSSVRELSKIAPQNINFSSYMNIYLPLMQKIGKAVQEGKITTLDDFIQAVATDFPNGKKMALPLQSAFQSWQQFYNNPQTKIETKKVIHALNKIHTTSPYRETLDGMVRFFGLNKDMNIPGNIFIFPKEGSSPVHSGFCDDQAVWMLYSLTRSEAAENYVSDTICLKRRMTTPIHETSHFLMNASQLWKDLKSHSNSDYEQTFQLLKRYFKAHPQTPLEQKYPDEAVLSALQEAFASCPAPFLAEKQGKPFSPDMTWYYGFETADKLAKQIYPLYKEYLLEGKTADRLFFKRLNENLKIFDIEKPKNISTTVSPLPTRLTGER